MNDQINKLYKTNEPALSAMMAFGRANRIMESLYGPPLAARGLTPAQFGILEVLYRCSDMRICELINTILMTSGNITVVIRNMERNGWITKTTDPSDKRSCIISLTDEGRALIELVLPEHIKEIVSLFDRLSSEEKTALRKILEKLK